MKSTDLVTFRGGFVASAQVTQRLIDLETRGCSFELQDDGGFRVDPVRLLDQVDLKFLREQRREIRLILEYQEELLAQPFY